MLLGRERERRAIETALATARSGASATLVLIGEPGIGKSALLDETAERADGMLILRARGTQSEAQIPFASLFELIRPALASIDQLPAPQAAALESALAFRPGPAQDRFAVGAATLSLLAAHAERGPVAVLIDDAQWLDEPSAQAMLFAFRRLLADSVAVIVAAREGEPSLIAEADLPTLRLEGLAGEDVAALLPRVSRETAEQLRAATGGNPLALLELAGNPDDLAFVPLGAAVPVPARIADAFARRAERLPRAVRQVLVLAAASDTADLRTLELAAARLDLDLSALAEAESAGLAGVREGRVEFRHVLARSAIYGLASAEERRAVHRALASSLPDRDVDRRAWHLAAAAFGTDDDAATALEQAGTRARARSAYGSAAGAFERAARLTGAAGRPAGLFFQAAEAAWLAGSPRRAERLLGEARLEDQDGGLSAEIAHLAGYMAIREGRVDDGRVILTAAARDADPERAVAMLAEATLAALAAGNPREMIHSATLASGRLSQDSSVRARFLAKMAAGMAAIFGADADAGARSIREAVALAETSLDAGDDPALHPWLVLGPLFLREWGGGRSLIERALENARARASLGLLPNLLVFLARDLATGDRWALAEASYREGIDLARESGQQGILVFGVAGLAWLEARRGRAEECRRQAAEALTLTRSLGLGMYEAWATAALGELELSLGAADAASAHFEDQQRLMERLGITDPDLSPAPDLVEAYVRLGRQREAQQLARQFAELAADKGQPWPLARSLRAVGLVAAADEFDEPFRRALDLHRQTPDVYETARTRLAYGERLRRGRNRRLARDQLRAALEMFARLGARCWEERAQAELVATGETVRRRDSASAEELTPQELQIAVLLASGRTTREAAAAVFLSPKTVEYHLRHVYLKLGINSRAELARVLGAAGRLPDGVDSPDRAATDANALP